MLANGATLAYKEKDGTGEYKNLPGLKELPEWGITVEKVENTALEDEFKQYEPGIGDLSDVVYKFKYDNTSAESPYRVMREHQENNTLLAFQETLKDGTVTEFDAYPSVKRTGAGVNGAIDFDLTLLLKGGFKTTDPA